MLQLERAGSEKTVEYRIVRDFMDALAKRKMPEIARGLGLTVEQVQEAVKRITCLEPHPGRALFAGRRPLCPAGSFRDQGGRRLCGDDQQRADSPSAHQQPLQGFDGAGRRAGRRRASTSASKIRAGKFLIKSLQQRQQTILNIGKEIVKRQREFMDKGRAYLKPMTMVQVAEVVKVHETTVSRAVSNKYMDTPQGIYEMKFFFTSGIQTDSGNGVSNTSVKDMVAAMFAGENTGKPLSDQEIVKMLKEKGIVIARRTVAKYRAELNILPSNLRKVY